MKKRKFIPVILVTVAAISISYVTNYLISNSKIQTSLASDNQNNETNKQEEQETSINKKVDENIHTSETQNPKVLTLNEAEELAKKIALEKDKAELSFEYIGDENTFNYIKMRGIEGYVFLPDAETDLAYLIDKNTSEGYYFHPSGYFKKIK